MRRALARLLPKKETVKEASIRFLGDYASYDLALAACNGSAGYESQAAIDRYVRRYSEVIADPSAAIKAASEQVLRFMASFSLAEPIEGVYHVYDYGGGYGAIYELFRHLYPAKKFRWNIIEVPALVARAAEMGASDEKIFSTELDAGPYSLGISSGTLQYLPDPNIGLEKMIAANARVTMFNRLPICDFLDRDRLTVQHIPSEYFEASIPAWFLSKRWRPTIERLGKIVAEWNSPGDLVKLGNTDVRYSAFLLKA